MATWFLRTPSLQAPTSRLNTSSSKPRKQLTRVFLRQREKLPNRSRIHTPCYSPTHLSRRLLKLKPFAAHGETTETDEKEVIEVEEESQAPLPQQPLELEIGKSFDIVDLLSSRSSGRYYLVRNNGDKVPIESLVGKTIGIYGVPLKVGEKEGIYSGTEDLIECYNEYNPSGKFEVVLVAVIDENGDFDATKDREMFQNCFSKMPWLAIPCQDIDSRKRLAKSNFTMSCPTCTILDPVGRAIFYDGLEGLCHFGPDCFPFTAERFKEINMEALKPWREKSLTSLLTSRDRDYLVDSQGTKIPARELEGKTVGLFFYYDYMEEEEFSSMIEMYETLRKRGEKFEIVMINTDASEEAAFRKASENMPWLAWPLSDKKYKRLVFQLFYFDYRLVMIGPNMEFLDELGFEVFFGYGIEAYPFTRNGLALKRVAKMREQSLESLLMSSGNKHVMTQAGTKVEVSELKGTTVTLFIGSPCCKLTKEFFKKLIYFYGEIKKSGASFEIVYVSCDEEDEDTYKWNRSGMPWLALPFQQDTKVRDLLYQDVFNLERDGMPYLLAFGPDGRFLTKNGRRKLLTHGLAAYPFNDDELLEEALIDINGRHFWPHPDDGIISLTKKPTSDVVL